MAATAIQRVERVEEGSPDTLLSADRLNDLARAIAAFCRIKGGPGVRRILQRGFEWKPVEAGKSDTVFNRKRVEELFAAVNGFTRTTGDPVFRVQVADGNVRLVMTGKAGTQIVEPPTPKEHLLHAHVANRLIDAVNRIWRCESRGNVDALSFPFRWVDTDGNDWTPANRAASGLRLNKADDGWILSFGQAGTNEDPEAPPEDGGLCFYAPSYNKTEIPQWEVLDGTLDLIGKLEPDGPEVDNLIPNTQMYWDLVGTTPPTTGVLQTKKFIAVAAGHEYELGLYIAGSQRFFQNPNPPARARIGPVVGTLADGSLLDVAIQPVAYNSFWEQKFYTFTSTADAQVKVNFMGIADPAVSTVGPLFDNVYLRDTTDNQMLIYDDFNGWYRCSTGLPFSFPDFIP